jgi:GT2 family glycosyltransferase
MPWFDPCYTQRMPKFSIITPTYNRANLLGRSIESVFAQTCQDFELIVVDDGSTDGTREVLDRYKDPQLRIARFEQNRGIGAARHEGVRRAMGDWVTFLDADDLWSPDKLACDLAVLERHGTIEFLFDNYRNINTIDQVDQTGFDQTRRAFGQLKTTELEPGVFRIDAGIAGAMLTANLIGTASIVTLRRTVFDRIGNFNQRLSGPEDFELFWRAALANVQFAYQTRVLVERHKDPGSITAQTCSFVPRLLEAFDVCETNLHSYDRIDLLPSLNQARGRMLVSLIHAHALEGHRTDAWRTFRSSLQYGFALDAFLYFSAALAGAKIIRLFKQLRITVGTMKNPPAIS